MDSHFTPEILADRWHINPNTLKQWRWSGKGPQYLKIGNCVLYRLRDIEKFEEEKLRKNTSLHGFS